MVPDGKSWKGKTGQMAGLEGYQRIQRNAVELDVVRHQANGTHGEVTFCGRPEFAGKYDIPLPVTINESVVHSLQWIRIGGAVSCERVLCSA